jgi:hypothetical protein
LITAYTASKIARLHATQHCFRPRADHLGEVKVPVNAATIKQMCAPDARNVEELTVAVEA